MVSAKKALKIFILTFLIYSILAFLAFILVASIGWGGFPKWIEEFTRILWMSIFYPLLLLPKKILEGHNTAQFLLIGGIHSTLTTLIYIILVKIRSS